MRHSRQLLRAIGGTKAGIYLLDKNGIVRFLSKPSLNGRKYDRADDGCRNCHASSGAKSGRTFIEPSGTQVLRNVIAIQNRQECQACHSPGDR